MPRRRSRINTRNNNLNLSISSGLILPSLSVFLLLILLSFIFFLDPVIIKDFIFPNSYILFFLLLLLFLLTTAYSFSKHFIRTVIISTTITIIFFLQLQKILNPFIFVLLITLPLSYEIFFEPVETSWLRPLITILMQYLRSRKSRKK